MRGRLLLGLLAAAETRLFGLGACDRRSEGWVARQREISRVYFAMGLTTSLLAGAIVLLLVLAVERRATLSATPGQAPDGRHAAMGLVAPLAPAADAKSPSRRVVGLGPVSGSL